MVQHWITDRTSGTAMLVLLTVSIGCWLLAASTAWTAAPVKLSYWQLKSSLFTGSVKTLILFLLCGVNDNICAALPLITEEQKRTRAERNAFNTFIEHVQAMDTDHPPVSHPQQMPVQSSSDTDHLQPVRDAYATTVMAVPHYPEDYDDTLDESMTEEFGEEIAVAMSIGQQLSPALKRHLLQAASAARERRTEFLEVLEQEEKALNSARTTLTELEDQITAALTQPLSDLSIDELLTLYDRLCDYERQCEAVLEHRQYHRTDGHATLTRAGSSHTHTDLQTYLYRSLPVTYPVLVDGSTLLEMLQRTQHRVTTELAWRD